MLFFVFFLAEATVSSLCEFLVKISAVVYSKIAEGLLISDSNEGSTGEVQL
ncbi:hypothetical protein ACP275_02G063100 [Erythranthe tilingii]